MINVDFFAHSRILAPERDFGHDLPANDARDLVRLWVRGSRLSTGQRIVAILIGPHPLPRGLPYTEAKVPDQVESSVNVP